MMKIITAEIAGSVEELRKESARISHKILTLQRFAEAVEKAGLTKKLNKLVDHTRWGNDPCNGMEKSILLHTRSPDTIELASKLICEIRGICPHDNSENPSIKQPYVILEWPEHKVGIQVSHFHFF